MKVLELLHLKVYLYLKDKKIIPVPIPEATPTLTLLHSEQPKLCGVLAILSAIGLNK